MAYQYDAFFSYKRDRESDKWHEVVKNKLEFWLRLELQREDVRIFFDTEVIGPGKKWRKEIVSALKQSRCIICVWSPLYFQSKWCYSEWMTFVRREEMANRGLVMPASFHDGESFPPAAKETQFLDFSPFANTMPKYWETDDAVQFQPLLQQFAHALADMIRNAPPFDEGFPVVELPDNEIPPEKMIERPANG